MARRATVAAKSEDDDRLYYVRDGWHLDKRIPISIICAIVLQTVGAFWWAATISQRVDYIEQNVTALSDLKESVVRMDERQAQIKAVVSGIRSDIREIKSNSGVEK